MTPGLIIQKHDNQTGTQQFTETQYIHSGVISKLYADANAVDHYLDQLWRFSEENILFLVSNPPSLIIAGYDY